MSRKLGLAPLIGLVMPAALLLSACDPIGAAPVAATTAATGATSPTAGPSPTAATSQTTATSNTADRKAVEDKATLVCGEATVRSCKDRGEIALKAIPEGQRTTDVSLSYGELVAINDGDWRALGTAIGLVTKLQAAFDAVKQPVTGTDSNGAKVAAPLVGPSASNLPLYNGQQLNGDPNSPPVVPSAAGQGPINSWTDLASRMDGQGWYWSCGETVTGTDRSTDVPKWMAVEKTGIGSRSVLAIDMTDDEALAAVREAGNLNIPENAAANRDAQGNPLIPIIHVRSYLNTRGIRNHQCETFIDSRRQARIIVSKMIQDALGNWYQDPYSGFAEDTCNNWGRLLREVNGVEVGPKRPIELPKVQVCSGSTPYGVWPVCKDSYNLEPQSQGNNILGGGGVAPAAPTTASAPAVASPSATAVYTAPSSPSPSTSAPGSTSLPARTIPAPPPTTAVVPSGTATCDPKVCG